MSTVRHRDWVRLPSTWIEAGGLRQLRWGSAGADNIAALLGLAVIAHHADNEGAARLTYDELCGCTSLSRAKLSAGLSVLRKLDVVESDRRSRYKLVGYNIAKGWCQLPAKNLYTGNRI